MSKIASREIRLVSRLTGIPTADNFAVAGIELAPPQDQQVRRGSSDRRWLADEIVQQPVKILRQKSAKVLEMPDFIGCFQFFTF
jgi:hypothetical protein